MEAFFGERVLEVWYSHPPATTAGACDRQWAPRTTEKCVCVSVKALKNKIFLHLKDLPGEDAWVCVCVCVRGCVYVCVCLCVCAHSTPTTKRDSG